MALGEDVSVTAVESVEYQPTQLSVESYLTPDEWTTLTSKVNSLLDQTMQGNSSDRKALLRRYPPIVQLISHSRYKNNLTIPTTILETLHTLSWDHAAEVRKIGNALFPQETKAHPLPEEEYRTMIDMTKRLDPTDSHWATQTLQQMERLIYCAPERKDEIQQFATHDLLWQIRRDMDNLLDTYSDDVYSYSLCYLGITNYSELYESIGNIIFANIERLQIFFPGQLQTLKNFNKLQTILTKHLTTWRQRIPDKDSYSELGKAAWYLALMDAERLDVTPDGSTLVRHQEQLAPPPLPEEFATR